MRKNFGVKPWTYPQPVFIIATYDENGKPDAMNAAWGGISDNNQITMDLSASHKTVKNLLKTGAFTVSMADAAHVVACDYVGLVSGNNTPDKFEKAGFSASKSEFVNAPIIEELPMAVECKVINYDATTGRLDGEIVNVSIDESVLTEDGKTDLSKFEPIVFDPINATYVKLGEKVGNAFKDGNILR
ncbi:flavin reductase family protein [Anaerosporobacter faecicola]|uniref:flavin reductase family protein n=1 Tax=Anaerosporobacter faecicola TaxID=2718714 RepID=UPI001439125E|nr:flavin reductase [Anaerosporobacter faecicola]